jgi:peptidoglycan/xylan/chitin deacetylase (PgdA/CDA1 family)
VTGFARKEALKRAVYYVCGAVTHFSGVSRFRALGQRTGSLRVIMYHKVNDQRGNSLSVPVARFDEQMRLLTERYNVISADELLAHIDGGAPMPPRSVLITFDDGYRDVRTNAYPILKRYELPAVLFVATDFIGGRRPFPHDGRFRDFDNAILGWDEIRDMSDTFEVGSHARSHRSLTALALADATAEIERSKAIIEGRLGRPVRLFSYPKGGPLDLGDDLRRSVIEAGYAACFTTIPKTNDAPLQRFDLGRYNVEPYGRSYFEWLLEGSCDLVGLGTTRLGALAKRAVVSGMDATTD